MKKKKKVKKLSQMTEKELQTYEVPWPETKKELDEIISELGKMRHTYGTSVYAMSIVAVAAYHYMAGKVGASGFQAECADLDIINRIKGWERFKILNMHDLLYPQYKEKFKSYEEEIIENADWLSKEAKKNLKKKNDFTHPDVIKHWKMLSILPDWRDKDES